MTDHDPARVAVVSGGGSGIGAGITRALADAGHRVVIGQRRAADARERAAALAAEASGRVIVGVGADLATREGPAALVSAAAERFGRIDVLVNNAAVTGPLALAALADYTDDQVDAIVDTNLKAPLRAVRAALPHLRRGSVVVNVSSVAATTTQPGSAAYAATKAGLNELTRQLAVELAARGVRAVWVSPGDVEVERQGRDEPAPAPVAGTLARHTPLGRRGRPADVGAAVAWLASDAAGWVTGTGLVVDGGWCAL